MKFLGQNLAIGTEFTRNPNGERHNLTASNPTISKLLSLSPQKPSSRGTAHYIAPHHRVLSAVPSKVAQILDKSSTAGLKNSQHQEPFGKVLFDGSSPLKKRSKAISPATWDSQTNGYSRKGSLNPEIVRLVDEVFCYSHDLGQPNSSSSPKPHKASQPDPIKPQLRVSALFKREELLQSPYGKRQRTAVAAGHWSLNVSVDKETQENITNKSVFESGFTPSKTRDFRMRGVRRKLSLDSLPNNNSLPLAPMISLKKINSFPQDMSQSHGKFLQIDKMLNIYTDSPTVTADMVQGQGAGNQIPNLRKLRRNMLQKSALLSTIERKKIIYSKSIVPIQEEDESTKRTLIPSLERKGSWREAVMGGKVEEDFKDGLEKLLDSSRKTDH